MPMIRAQGVAGVGRGQAAPPPRAAAAKARDQAKAVATVAAATLAAGKGAIGISLKAADAVQEAEKGRVEHVSLMYSQERSGIALSFSRTERTREKMLVDGTWKKDAITLGGTRVAQTLCNGMRLETLREVELVGLKLPSELYRMLCKGMEKNSSLRVLCFNDSEVGDKNLSLLLPGIKEHQKLSRLQLCNASLTDAGGRELMEVLRQQAERLSLASWRQSLRTSVSKAETDVGVKVVALSYNALGEETLSLLSSVLALDSPLREVYMKGCSSTPTCSNALQECLVDNTRLETLDLRDLLGAPGWLWDTTQKPPLIMQDFLPRPDVRKVAHERPEGLPPRYVFGTASALASTEKDSTRGAATAHRWGVRAMPSYDRASSSSPLRSRSDCGEEQREDSTEHFESSAHRFEHEESALDPSPSWNWDPKQHKAEKVHRVHIAPNPRAAHRAPRGLFKGQPIVAQVPAKREGGGVLIGAADEAARQQKVLQMAGQLDDLVKDFALDDVESDWGSRGMQRTKSAGDMLGAWADSTQARRPVRDSHMAADALLDPATDTPGSSRRAQSEERGQVNVVDAVKGLIRQQVKLRLHAESRALKNSMENASLRRKMREMQTRAAVAPLSASGEEEEKLLLELEETIYFLSNKVRELEEGGSQNSELQGQGTKGFLDGHASQLVADRLKQMWGGL